MSDDMREVLDRAVMEACSTYKDADKSPVDHGHAMIRGIDGRTKLADAMKDHPAIDVRVGGYHGTTAVVDDVNRYLSAQRGAYESFIKTLQAEGVSGADELHIWTHGH